MAKQTADEVSTEMILSHLRAHLNEQRPVMLYNTYQGVPITFEAEVAMIHPAYVGLIVHPYQAVCIKEERRTYIESKTLPSLVRAYPVSIDYTNQVVMLKRLKIPKSITPDLFNSWVAPEKSVRVEISADNMEDLTVKMIEIAVLEENQIHVAVSVPEDAPFNRLDAVHLAFKLDSKADLIQVQGVVHSLTKIRGQDRKRMEVAGKATMGDEITILAYVAKREDQIMAELDKAYQKLRRGKGRKK